MTLEKLSSGAPRETDWICQCLALASPARLVACVLAASMLSSCGLPRSGPTRSEIFANDAANDGSGHVVPVTSSVAAASRSVQSLGFDSAFLNAGSINSDVIRPGDVLSVTVWENVDNGLLASVGQKVTILQELQVDQSGSIFMPYAGRLLARGRHPSSFAA